METNGTLPCIDLNALVEPVAHVELDGIKHDVLPVQGDAMDIFEQIAAENRARRASGKPLEETEEERKAHDLRYLERARRIVMAVAPSIPAERVRTMMVVQLMAIAALAVDPVLRVRKVVEQAEGKGGGPVRKSARRSGRK